MSGFRRRYLLALPVVAAIVWSCAVFREEFHRLRPPPPSFDQIAFRNAVLASAPPLSQFDSTRGQSGYLMHARLRGSIFPHVNAGRDSLYHGKFLAIIRVDAAYRGLKPNVWNYWVVVDTSSVRRGKYTSAFVAADNSNHIAMRYLSVRLHHGHKDPDSLRARWISYSHEVPWGECSPGVCCCEGPGCKNPGG
jgi:hypothetical protein